MNKRIEVDYREKKFIELTKKYKQLDNIIYVKNLNIGDIIIYNENNRIIIERKTETDLISSIKDGRYKEQKIRLLNENNNNTIIIYIIEGNSVSNGNNNINSSMFHGSLISMVFRDNINILRTFNINETVILILKIWDRLCKKKEDFFNEELKCSQLNNEIKIIKINQSSIDDKIGLKNTCESDEKKNENIKNVNLEYLECIKTEKKKNMNPNIWNCIALSSIPRVSKHISLRIIERYKSINNLVNIYNSLDNIKDKEELLSNINISTIENKKKNLGPKLSKTIYLYISCSDLTNIN